MDTKLQIKNLLEKKFQKLRHIWLFLSIILNFVKFIIRICDKKKVRARKNITNNMEQDLIEEQREQPQQQQQQPQQQQQEHDVQAPQLQVDPPAVDDMDLSDSEDDGSVQDFDELYSSGGEDDGEWSSSNESEATSVASACMPLKSETCMRRFYIFRPLCLLRCQYKDKHTAGEFPLARSGHRIIASNSHLYSLGGYNPRSALTAARHGQCLLFQELWSYNFATNRWKLEMNANSAKDMPAELASNALAIHNNILISHGGTGYPFGESCSNDCYVYKTGTHAAVARLKVTGDLPTAQYGPGIVIHENYLYTIGGTTGFDYSCDIYRLDLRTCVWENVYICRPEMRDDPEGRYRHEVVYDGNHIYVLGGGTSHSVYDLQRIPAFNLNTNKWDYFDTKADSSLATLDDGGYPKPRKCFSCVQHALPNGDIEAFVTGGLQGDFSTYFADIWKLNLRTKQWSRIQTASFPKPLYFHSAAHSDNGCMYVFGGIEYTEKDMRRRNELYKMWMIIPKLSEMCWDALTYYNENLDQVERSSLLKLGIPSRFVERLPPQRIRKTPSVSKDQTLFSHYPSPKRARGVE